MWWKIVTFSIIFLFSTKYILAISAPTQISPSNGSSISSSTVTWQAPSYELYSGNAYRVQVDDDPNFSPSSGIYRNYYTDKTSYSPTLTDGTWYWRVKAKDSTATWSDWSNVWSFILSTTPTASPTPTPTLSLPSSSSFTISNVPSQIDSTETFNTSVNLSLYTKPNTIFYLKGAFAKSGSTNYFGLTKVGSDWIKNNSSYSKQYSLTTDSSGYWSGDLEVQPDIMDSGYEGSGDYIFKVGRYTSSGSGPTWTSEVTIKINAKEVEIEGEVTNLSGLTTKKQESVLGESQKVSDLPESVYSLENYRRTSTSSATPSSVTPSQVKSEKINLSIILGGILLSLSGGILAYIILKNRVFLKNKLKSDGS